MKLVNRQQFLALPRGTIYAMGKPWYFDGLQIKGDTCGNDWFYNNLCWIEADNSEQAIERLERMLQNGDSFPMEQAESRDGSFDNDALFLIFEIGDLLDLRIAINMAIATASAMQEGGEA